MDSFLFRSADFEEICGSCNFARLFTQMYLYFCVNNFFFTSVDKAVMLRLKFNCEYRVDTLNGFVLLQSSD